MGPARQSKPIHIVAVSKLAVDHQPIAPGGMLGPLHAVVVGVFFLLREIELSLLLVRNVKVQGTGERSSVTLSLPASKTDPFGTGTERTWGCVCFHGYMNMCPVHAIIKQLAILHSVFPSGEVDQLSLFPTSHGETVSKIAVVQTINELERRAGYETANRFGESLFGGHSMRTGGAVHLSSFGLSETKIEAMARWRSPMLLHYARQAPLRAITEEYKQRTLEKYHEYVARRSTTGTKLHKALQPSECGSLVVNNLSLVSHRVAVYSEDKDPSE